MNITKNRKELVMLNLIQHLRRLWSLLVNNLRGRFQIKFGMTSLYKDEVLNKDDFRAPLRSGFTLIELLVVVLIVAILAAIALPQYQLSVEKSRMAEAIILLKTIASAHQYYYLTHGTYLNSGGMDKLDISIENNITPKMASRKQTQYFLYSPEISPTSGYLAAAKRLPSSTEDSEYPYWLGITQAEPDKIECHQNSNIITAAQRKLCEQIKKTGKL